MAGNKIAVDKAKLRFARGLYEKSVERYGADHEQTRLLRDYITQLDPESRAPWPFAFRPPAAVPARNAILRPVLTLQNVVTSIKSG